jgi:hypothetical protein
MEKYISQLLDDIAYATQNISTPFIETEFSLGQWVLEEEENNTAPVRNLQEWTGIKEEMLPPAKMLTKNQVHRLLVALNKMLDEYNCCFVLQTKVPDDIHYETIRMNFNQKVKVKQWHMGFFEMCRPGTEQGKCTLGKDCQCAFYTELFKGFVEETPGPEEERTRMLDIEVRHIKRKYGDDWMKYYPYHLDKNYDDEKGNTYNYGFDDRDDEGDDNWWRR